VTESTDEGTGVPVYSLYGENRRPTPEILKGVEVLLFDIQDVGVRFYTYISTMGEGMAAAADKGIPFVVLDRPNPVTAGIVEGRMLDFPSLKSFVGAFPIPIRYGLTVGELALYVRDILIKSADLKVVRMKNYHRSLWYDQTGLPWVAPSPNIPTPTTATVYPGMCLIEGTNMSEGRGTTQPFELIGAPWIDGLKLAHELNALKLAGVLFRPAYFTPTVSKYQGENCQGVQVHVTDRLRFRPVEAALHIVTLVRRKYPSQFRWRESAFDRLSGSEDVRLAVESGNAVEQVMAAWQEGRKEFESARRRHLLYPE
jgi:uncharacterized protein YbbC (DUF1343 family)